MWHLASYMNVLSSGGSIYTVSLRKLTNYVNYNHVHEPKHRRTCLVTLQRH